MPSEALRQARLLKHVGQREQAAQIAADVIRQDENNVEAWVLLSQLLDDPQQIAECQARITALIDTPGWSEEALEPPALQARAYNLRWFDYAWIVSSIPAGILLAISVNTLFEKVSLYLLLFGGIGGVLGIVCFVWVVGKLNVAIIRITSQARTRNLLEQYDFQLLRERVNGRRLHHAVNKFLLPEMIPWWSICSAVLVASFILLTIRTVEALQTPPPLGWVCDLQPELAQNFYEECVLPRIQWNEKDTSVKAVLPLSLVLSGFISGCLILSSFVSNWLALQHGIKSSLYRIYWGKIRWYDTAVFQLILVLVPIPLVIPILFVNWVMFFWRITAMEFYLPVMIILAGRAFASVLAYRIFYRQLAKSL